MARPPFGNTNTTLVLGAGSNCSLGFRTGLQLRKDILELADPFGQAMRVQPHRLLAFQAELRNSALQSIDAFLARRLEFSEIGKLAIASILLKCEQQSDLYRDDDNWYAHLVNQLFTCPWEDLSLESLSVVTFNYDRSLEHFLFNSLKSSYGKSSEETQAKLSELKIVHVYGQLGDYFNGPNHVPYGSAYGLDDMRIWTVKASEGINIIAEGRQDSPAVLEAQALVERADNVCFLGFAYDPDNLARIGAPKNLLLPDGRLKNVVATTLGMSQRERWRVSERLFGRDKADFHSDKLWNCKCLDLLRETLILG